MSYVCTYDQVIDDAVAAGTTCTSLPGTATFNTSTGVLAWTPSSLAWGPYEIKVVGTNAQGSDDEVFVIDVRPAYVQTNLLGAWDAQFANLTKPLSGSVATWYDLTSNAANGTGTSLTGAGSGTTTSPYSMDFGGSSRVTFSTALSSMTQFMTSLWVKATTPTAVGKVILSNSGNGSGNGWSIDQDTAGSGKARLSVGKTYDGVIMSQGPAGYWRLGETSGTTAYDLSGNNNTGTYTGTYTLAQTGALSRDPDKAFSLSGAAGYVNVPNSATIKDYTAGDSLTVSAWVKRGATGAYYPIASKMGTEHSSQRNWQFGFDNQDHLLICFYSGSYIIYASAQAFTDTANYHHYAVTFTFGTASSAKLYVDGVLVAGSWTGDGSLTPVAPGGPLRIGTTPFPEYFSGGIDELAVFSKTLTAAEIGAQYAAGASAYAGVVVSQTPVGYWRLGESSGTTAYDISGNGYNGTYTSATLAQTGALGDGSTGMSVAAAGYMKMTTTAITGANPDTTGESYSMWVKMNAIGTQSGLIQSAASNDPNSTTPVRLLQVNTDGTIRSYGYSPNTTSALSTTVWKHVAWTLTSTTSKIYINGVLEVNDSSSDPIRGGGASPLQSIWLGSGYPAYVNAKFQDFAVFNRTLTDAEVLAQYKAGAGAYRMTVLDQGPAGYWRLGETSGSFADSSGNGNTGSVYSAPTRGVTGALTRDADLALTASSAGGALHPIAGSATIKSYNTGETVTATFWAKRTSTGGTRTVVHKMADSGGYPNWSVFFDADQLMFKATSSTAVNNEYRSTATYADTTAWHHYAVTHTFGDASSTKLYVDGSLVAGRWSTGSGSFVPLTTQNGQMSIGMNAQMMEYFEGNLDDVAVFSKTLTAAEILAQYQAGAASYKNTCLSSSALTASQWTQLGALSKGTTAALFTNGVPSCAMAMTPGTSIASPATSLTAGATSTGGNAWTGSIGEIQVYGVTSGTVGTASDIDTNFAATSERYLDVLQTNLTYSFDPARANAGTGPYANGCAAGDLSPKDLSTSNKTSTLTGFASCGSTSGWTGDGTRSISGAAGPYRLTFDGSNDYVEVPYTMSGMGALSVGVWYYQNNTGAGQPIMSWATWLSHSGPAFLNTAYGGTNRVDVYVASNFWPVSNYAVAQNTWHYLVSTWNGTTWTVYLDGTQIGSYATGYGASPGTNLYLGNGVGSGSNYLNGHLGPIQVYSSALTQTQIQQNCVARKGRFAGAVCN